MTRLPEEVYRAMSAALLRIAERQEVPKSECEDVVQETWRRAFRHRDKFKGERTLGRLFAWLARIVQNVAKDTRCRLSQHPAQSLDVGAEELMNTIAEPSAAAADKREELSDLLARLRQENPENFWLLSEHRVGQRSIQELADQSGRTENEVRCRIYRAMEKLRAWGSEFSPGSEDTS